MHLILTFASTNLLYPSLSCNLQIKVKFSQPPRWEVVTALSDDLAQFRMFAGETLRVRPKPGLNLVAVSQRSNNDMETFMVEFYDPMTATPPTNTGPDTNLLVSTNATITTITTHRRSSRGSHGTAAIASIEMPEDTRTVLWERRKSGQLKSTSSGSPEKFSSELDIERILLRRGDEEDKQDGLVDSKKLAERNVPAKGKGKAKFNSKGLIVEEGVRGGLYLNGGKDLMGNETHGGRDIPIVSQDANEKEILDRSMDGISWKTAAAGALVGAVGAVTGLAFS